MDPQAMEARLRANEAGRDKRTGETLMTMKATNISNINARQVTWRCEPPLEGNEYVVSSLAYALDIIPPETYIFPADKDGKITDWGELDGSFQGDWDHVQALKNAGYEPVIKE